MKFFVYLSATLFMALLYVQPLVGEVVANRDKTGTKTWHQKEEGSQVLVNQALASHVFFRAEGMGLEPTTGYPASHFQCENDSDNTGEKAGFSTERSQFADDPDLAAIVKAWPNLPDRIKGRILELADGLPRAEEH